MTYYREWIGLAEQVNEWVKNGGEGHISKLVKWARMFVLCICIIGGIGLGLQEGSTAAGCMGGCLILGLFGSIWIIMEVILRRRWKKWRKYRSRIALGDSSVDLIDEYDRIEGSVDYRKIVYAEVVPLIGLTSAGLRNVPLKDKNGERYYRYTQYDRMHFICLHIERTQIREGDYKSRYDKNKNVILFAYEDSAWEILCRHISKENMKSMREATPIDKVKWRDSFLRPVGGGWCDSNMM